MNKLKFLNPVGIKSDNFSTVRLGDKWAKRTELEEGQQVCGIELADRDGKVLGTAVVRGCWVGPLADVPAILLECCHDPVYRTWSGVKLMLVSIYKDPTISYVTLVTVLQVAYTGPVIKTPDLIVP